MVLSGKKSHAVNKSTIMQSDHHVRVWRKFQNAYIIVVCEDRNSAHSMLTTIPPWYKVTDLPSCHKIGKMGDKTLDVQVRHSICSVWESPCNIDPYAQIQVVIITWLSATCQCMLKERNTSLVCEGSPLALPGVYRLVWLKTLVVLACFLLIISESPSHDSISLKRGMKSSYWI